jgi:glycerophosphoryl diester phosphodiesterase
VGTIEIIAHRGFSARFPENTLLALDEALGVGADALEWDIQVAADGVPVLFHDDTLDRTTDGNGELRSRTSKDLARLDAGSWLSPDFIGTRIPTLSEALRALAGRAGRIYPELKAVRAVSDLDSILREIRESGFLPHTVLISLDHRLLEEVRARDSEIHLGWVVSRERDMARCMRRVEKDGRAILDPSVKLLLAKPVRTREMVASGIPLATWTVNTIDQAKALLDLGVRRFTTNEVELMVGWARSVESEEGRG